MRNGKFKIGKYNIEPTTSVDTFPSGEYNVVNTKNGVVYISKKPLELCGSDFWVTIYFEKMNIKKIELNNANEKYKMNYQTMDSITIEHLRKENNDFLINNLGSSNNEKLSGLEYEYSWGKIISYFDFKSAEAGIVIYYFWLYFLDKYIDYKISNNIYTDQDNGFKADHLEDQFLKECPEEYRQIREQLKNKAEKQDTLNNQNNYTSESEK